MSENGFTPQIIPELQEKINDSDIQKTLSHLLGKLEMIESSVTKLNTALELAPGFISMATDVADSTQKSLQARGIEIEERAQSLMTLLDKLSEPGTVEKIQSVIDLTDRLPGMTAMAADMFDAQAHSAQEKGIQLDERLDVALKLADRLTAPGIVEKLDGLLSMLEKAPGMSAMTTDIIDTQMQIARENGVDIDQRFRTVLRLSKQMTDPQTIQTIEKLLDLTDKAPGIFAIFVDAFDDKYRNALSKGLDFESLGQQGLLVFRKMADLFISEEFDALIASGVFDPKALEVLSVISGAMIQCRTDPPKRMSIFGAMRALRNPEMQKSLGFLVAFGRNFGNLCNQVIERDNLKKLNQEQQNQN